MGRWAVGVGAILGIACLAGCDDNLFGVSDGSSTSTPETPGYPGVVAIVASDCLLCHSAASSGTAGFGLDLETDLHGALVGVTGAYGVPLVTPNDPDASLFYQKITGANPDGTGGAMPPGSTGLGLGKTDLVRAWIDDGAPGQ